MRLTAFPWDGSTSLDLSSPALLPARSNVKRQTAAAAGVPKPPVPGLVETFVHLVKMKEFVCLCLGYIPVMMMRTSLTNWTAVMFASKNLSLATAAACMSTLELGGFAGGLSGGWITDKIGGRRGPVMCCFSIMCAPLSLAVQAAVQARSTAFFLPVAYFLHGFFSFPPHSLIGLLAREKTPPMMRSTAGCLAKAVGQLGAVLAGYPLQVLAARAGWQVVGPINAICGVVAAGIFLPLWRS